MISQCKNKSFAFRREIKMGILREFKRGQF